MIPPAWPVASMTSCSPSSVRLLVMETCSLYVPLSTWMVAPAGATIHVDKGTYSEQVSITKSLTLEGEHEVIDATGQAGGIIPPLVGYGLLVFGPGASGSVVEGFTVENAIGEGILVAG